MTSYWPPPFAVVNTNIPGDLARLKKHPFTLSRL